MKQFPNARELVLAGGGHSHVIFLRILAMQPIPGLKVTLISPETAMPYSGMLPGLVAGHYERDDVYIDLVPLCQFAGVDFVKGQVVGLDPIEQSVEMSGRPALRYDLLSIDVGSTSSSGKLVGNAIIPVKPISLFLEHWQKFIDVSRREQIHDVAFVGAGAGGVELCLAVHHCFSEQDLPGTPRIHLVTEGSTLLKEFPTSVQREFEKLLQAREISVHKEFRAAAHRNSLLYAEDGRELAADRVFCVTQAEAQDWFRAAGLTVDAEGFILVRDTLQTQSFDNVFAVGDCATMINYPRPKAGVFAVRQGEPLYNNIRRLLHKETLSDFRPQSRYLALITTGAKHAVASRNGLSISGAWVWRWKDWIDQRFMQRFSDLPEMKNSPTSPLLEEFDHQMYCGGCGSKVSADLLVEVISELLGDQAPVDDAAQIEVPTGKVLLQSVDHFRSVIDDPYLQARIAVCHAFSDIYACGGEAGSVLAALTLPFAKPNVTRGLLTQILQGALDQLTAEGARLVGGHTSEGLELSIGFTANGFVSSDDVWSKAGAQAGDVLLLTKALGTGTLLAANKQYRARGDWVKGAVDSMLLSNRAAVSILRDYDIKACTDITGFGLAGHLEEMLGKQWGATLEASNIPVLPGALSCLQEGISSSLHSANRRSVKSQKLPSLFYDPQTSGGLLIALPGSEAEACMNGLRQAGYNEATVIGEVTAGTEVTLR